MFEANPDRWLEALEDRASMMERAEEAARQVREDRPADEYGRPWAHPDYGYRGAMGDICKDCGWQGDAWMSTGDARTCPLCRGGNCVHSSEME